MERTWERNSFGKRLGSMLAVDFRRLFTTRLFYAMMGVAIVIPILVLVMTTMNSGGAGQSSGADMFSTVWQAIGSVSGSGNTMDLTSMCNINMMYFLAAVLVCGFVSDDFRSGYSKNLFTVRSQKNDYIISKMLTGFVGSALLLAGFFLGAVLGGAIAGLSFVAEGISVSNIIFCMIAKVFLMAVFVAIYLVVSVLTKQKFWLSLLLSFGVGMLLFNMIPMLTPLDSTMMNALLCLAGGVIFCVVLGLAGNLVLRKTDLI